MISKVVSMDIMRYLQEKKGMSIKDIAKAMDTTETHIKMVSKSIEILTPKDVNTYVKFAKLQTWEFIISAIPIEHVPEKARKRILLCKQLTELMEQKENGGK